MYTAGNNEPWCADFISWVMKESGYPLDNPNSSSWRIPGVFILREYYRSENRYRMANEYVPRFGDVAIYAKTAEKSHTNIVLAVDTKTHTMTTIGGNEEGHVRIKHKSYERFAEDLDGFGVLPQ